MKKIEVLGPGCVKCAKLAENVAEALREAGVEGEVTKVQDMFEIMQRGCNRTPGIMIDGQLKLQGRVATVKEIRDWLAE